jgi:uncharacterized protein involved in exopolysaccharide biosynthesis
MRSPVPPVGVNASLPSADDDGLSLLDVLRIIAPSWRRLVVWPLLAGLLAYGATWLIKPSFTAKTTFLPPQQQSGGGAAAALQSLGALAALAGAGGVKTPADQYVSLLQSTTVTDRLIDQFKLQEVYDEKYRMDARKELTRNVRALVGKKDGLISVEVDDTDPKRAADMANQHIEELRRLSSQLAMTEAQQRRVFFEGQLKQTRDNLTQAQIKLQETGFNQGALKSEPKAAAEGYARLRAEVTAAEVKLQALRRAYVDTAPEFQQQLAVVSALRGQLSRLEQSADATAGGDYVTKFRDYKYHETLFELFARQYELARVDESREGAFIQVVDVATPPERKSKPKRALIAGAAALAALVLTMLWILLRHFWRDRARTSAV